MLCTLLFQINHLNIFVWHNYWDILACLGSVSLSEYVKEAAILHIGIVSLPGSRWSTESWGVSLAQLEPWSSLAVYCCSAWMEMPFGSLDLFILILCEKMRIVFSPHHIFQQVTLKISFGLHVFAFAVFFSCWSESGARTWDQLLPLPLSCHSWDGAGCHGDAPEQPCDCPWQPCGSSAELKLLFLVSENTALWQTGGTETIYTITVNRFHSLCCMQTVFHGTLKAH